MPIKHIITGEKTAGQPTSGYASVPEIFPHWDWLHNESGHNESTSAPDGRTGIACHRVRLTQEGQGDLYALWVTGHVNSTREDSTSFLANPAAIVVGANLAAGADGAYLNPGEFLLDDEGNDAAAIGWVVNMRRSNATGAKNAWWAGFRSQSIGDEPVDAHFSASGKARFGLDLSFGDYGTGKAAITVKADDRFYFEAVNTDSSGLARFPSSCGDTYLTFASSLGALHAVVNNASALQIYANQVLSPQPIRTEVEFRVGIKKVLGAPRTGWEAATGTAARGTFDTTTVTLEELAERVKAMLDDFLWHGALSA